MFIATPIPENLKPQRGEMSSVYRAPTELADLRRRVAINITPLTGLRPGPIVPAKRANVNSRGCQPTEPSVQNRVSPEGAELLPHSHASQFGPFRAGRLSDRTPWAYAHGYSRCSPVGERKADFCQRWGSFCTAGISVVKLRRIVMFIVPPIPANSQPQRGEICSGHRAPTELADLLRRVAINITPLTGLRPCSIVPAKRADVNSRGCQPTEPSPRKRTSPEATELLPHSHASRFGPFRAGRLSDQTPWADANGYSSCSPGGERKSDFCQCWTGRRLAP